MAASGGAIVNVSSCWGGRAPGPNHALYRMAKAAIASLTQCMGITGQVYAVDGGRTAKLSLP